jgi:myo-inositol-1(or 4)-monophosphatase
VDKKELLSPNLARIMVGVTPEIHQLLDLYPSAPSMLKDDGSPVTKLDLALSDLLERISLNHFKPVTVYSEEKYSDWKFPLMAIDPLDGTREYIRARPEWSVSIGYFENDNFQGQGWVYNPMTRELYNSEQTIVNFVDKKVYYGEVSHSEWDRGWYHNIKSEKFKLSPKGSIAYKLGRLSGGKSDFVVSLAPKNIWDIAGGTLLCQRAGMKFYSQGKEVTKVQKQYLPPLIWCFENSYLELSSLFPPMDTDL